MWVGGFVCFVVVGKKERRHCRKLITIIACDQKSGSKKGNQDRFVGERGSYCLIYRKMSNLTKNYVPVPVL